MRLETVHPKELGPADHAAWRAHQSASAALASPYLSPDWAALVGAVRADARVCVINDGAGFVGVQKLSRFSAMGLGAPIADYQGLVSSTPMPIDGAALCRALGVGRIDLSHAPPAHNPFLHAGHTEGSWIAETFGGRDLYEAAIRAQRAEFVRQTDKKLRKLGRDSGDVSFHAQVAAREDFDALLAWKRAQLHQTGQPAIWDTPWVRQTINRCFDLRDAQFGGVLFTMRVGGQLAAANFCLRAGEVMNMWIIAHDDAFEAGSPGVQLARWIIGWAGENGVREIDFGPGDYRYKRQLATTQRALAWGVVAGASVSGLMRRAQYALRTQLERAPSARLAALPGKAMRRLDLMRALAA